MKNLKPRPAMPILMAALAAIRPGKRPAGIATVPSHKIEPKEETKHEWAKRTQQKMKGKGARMNRGRNRKKIEDKPQDTALYAMLRR